jgi:hypothetical protein
MDTLFPESDFTQNPYPVHAELRRVCPVARVDVGDRDGYLITGHDEACAALADFRLSTDARFLDGLLSSRAPHPAVTRTMLTSDPPRH